MTIDSDAVVPESATCLGCGYALRGIRSRTCPECGRAFDPYNPWTMAVPRTPFGWEKRQLDPTNWPFDRIRKTLIVGVVLSAWFPPPNPWPLLFLGVYWLRWAVPSFVRRLARRRIAYVYHLPTDVLRVDAAGLQRLRRMFGIALLLLLLHAPFWAAYAVSYPFFARSARHWLTVAPATENPRAGPTLCGVMPVMHRHAELRSVTYFLPGGMVVFYVDQEKGGISNEVIPYVPPESFFHLGLY